MEEEKLIKNTKDLMELMGAGKTNEDIEEEKKNWRYVLYARKSTDEANKQVRSLSDQVIECKEFADKNGINIIDIIQESQSAKYSGTRDKFTKMLEDIEKHNKYDGILAWHPNRLARNMKDAGEIIDLLDKGILKDLRFPSFYFENSASGKLTLSITFALAKQYTDQLSDDITRGNKRITQEGVSISVPSHGYRKDSSRKLIPNGNNFNLIKEAFKKRLAGDALESICEFLEKNGYEKSVLDKKDWKSYINEKYTFNKDTLTSVFKNPIYTGVMRHGSVMVDLAEKYEFVPMITVEEYCKINNIKDKTVLLNPHKKDKIKAKLLNGKIFCVCNKPMTAGITKKKQSDGSIKNMFYYRCVTKGCINHGKSIRAKEVVDGILENINNFDIVENKAYKKYLKTTEEEKIIKNKEILNSIKSNEKEKYHLKDKIEKTKNMMSSLPKEDTRVINSYKESLKEQLSKLEDRELLSIELNKQKDDNTNVAKTLEKFVELLRNMANIIKKTGYTPTLRKALEMICLNCHVENKKVVKLELNEPFNGFMELKKDPKVLSGGHTKN